MKVRPSCWKHGWLAAALFLGIVSAAVAQDALRSAPPDSDEEATRQKPSADSGITFPVTLTTETVGNLSGGSERAVIWESLLKAGIEVDFEKAYGWKGFSATINGLYPAGEGLTDRAVHDFNVLSNLDAYDSPRLYEAWLQQDFAEGKFSIRLGQLLADAEFFASEYGALFVNSSFGAIPLVSQNLRPPIFPVAAPGFRLRVSPNQSFYAEAAFFSGDVGDPGTNNKHNLRWSFPGSEEVLVFGEIGYKVNPRDHKPALPVETSSGEASASSHAAKLSGTYKLSGYFDSGEFADNRTGSSHHGNYSIYFIADQELWHPAGDEDRALSFFTRLGAAPEDRNTVSFYGDMGLNMKGLLPARSMDTLGLGGSYTRLSEDLSDEDGRELAGHHELVIELTYHAVFGDHVALQPDLQFIVNPGAVRPAALATIIGLRLTLTY